MQTRPNSLPIIRLYGDMGSTLGCEGPFLSIDKGMDSPCCARCHIIRMRIYRSYGKIITDQTTIDYLIKLNIKCIGVDTSYAISTCGKPYISTHPYSSELEYGSAKEFLKAQFLFRRDHMIAYKEFDIEYVSMTTLNLPVILPTPKDIKYNEYKGDEGVEIHNGGKTLIITNTQEVYNSGKWVYLLNYYQACKNLFDIVDIDDIINGEFVIF